VEEEIERHGRERISSNLIQNRIRGVLARMLDMEKKIEIDRDRMARFIQRNYRRHRFFVLVHRGGDNPT